MTGFGATSAVLSAVDPAGSVGPILESANLILESFSRLRSVNVTLPYKESSRTLDYSNWLVQTCPQPYNATVDATSTATPPVRVLYPEAVADSPIVPSIRMAG